MSNETKRLPEQSELSCHGAIAPADRLNIYAASTRIYRAVTMAWDKCQSLVQLAGSYAPLFHAPTFNTYSAPAHAALVEAYDLWIEVSDAVQL